MSELDFAAEIGRHVNNHEVGPWLWRHNADRDDLPEALATDLYAAGWRHVGTGWLDLPNRLQADLDRVTAERDLLREHLRLAERRLARADEIADRLRDAHAAEVATLTAERDHARDLAVTLEQENARQAETITRTDSGALTSALHVAGWRLVRAPGDL